MFDKLNAMFGSNDDPYEVWGDLAPTIKTEGWKFYSTGDSGTMFIPGYSAAGRNVMIDGKPNGIVVVNKKKNGKVDIFIRDQTGKHPDFYVKQDINPQDAHNYFTNSQSTISQRVNDLQKSGAVAKIK